MDGKGKGGPRVEYFDEDIALTQKLTRPKLPPQPGGPESAPSLQPKQGGAVDAEALRRIRRVSAPNLLAIRMPGDPAASEAADRTVARANPLPGEAFPSSEAAPSTIPEDDESTLRQRKRERELAPLVPDEEPDSETSPGGFSDAMVTKQVPADVARRLLSEVAAMDSAHVRAAMGAGPAAPREDSLAATLPVGATAPRAPPGLRQAAPLAERAADLQPLGATAPLAERRAPAPPPPPDAEDRRDPAQTLASLPKPAREAPGFTTLPLGSSSGQVDAAMRSAAAAAPSPGPAPSALMASFGSTHLMPQSMPLPLVTPASPAPAVPGSTPPMPAVSALGASGSAPSVGALGASGSVPSMGALGASGSVPSMGALGASGSAPSMGALGGAGSRSGGITVPPGSGGALSASGSRAGGITVPPASSGVASGLPVAAPRKRSRAWLWALLALALVGLVVGGGVLAKRRNPRIFSMPYKVG